MFGSHLSVAGGMVNALREAETLTMETVQVFTKNQRQWAAPPLDPGQQEAWLSELRRMKWTDRTVSHASYLINLATPDDALWEKSIAAMKDEIERCAALEIPFLVHHPGAHVGSGVEAGLQRIARAYKRLMKETKRCGVVACLEATAGGGSTLGRSFEELATLKGLIEEEAGREAEGRVGFCVDTCHVLAAGYDIASTDKGDGTGKARTLDEGIALGRALLEEFDRVCGLKHLRVLHLNDSLGSRGSHVDRHAHVGEGKVALGAFGAVVNHGVSAGVPMILETPKGEDEKGRPLDSVNLAKLRKLVVGVGTAPKGLNPEKAPKRKIDGSKLRGDAHNTPESSKSKRTGRKAR